MNMNTINPSVITGANSPVCFPSARPQPAEVAYGVDALELFPSFTRNSFRQAFGVDAPAWNPAFPAKYWFDSSVSAAQGNYNYVAPDGDGGFVLQQQTLSAAEAKAVNIPGAIVYAKYEIAPTDSSRGPGTFVNPVLLSLESEARALKDELGAAGYLDEGATSMFPVIYPRSEERRMWAVLYNSGERQKNVGALLQLRHAAGVDSPGHWDMSSGNPLWVAAPAAATGLDDTRPSRPVPLRALFQNEVLRPLVSGFGVVSPQVVRLDLETETAKRNGAFLPEDRQMLQEIYRVLVGTK